MSRDQGLRTTGPDGGCPDEGLLEHRASNSASPRPTPPTTLFSDLLTDLIRLELSEGKQACRREGKDRRGACDDRRDGCSTSPDERPPPAPQANDAPDEPEGFMIGHPSRRPTDAQVVAPLTRLCLQSVDLHMHQRVTGCVRILSYSHACRVRSSEALLWNT